MWRPQNWKKYSRNVGNAYSEPPDIYEAGADTMLKTLRREGYHIFVDPQDNGICLNAESYKGKRGTLVFIPDDKREK